MQVGSLFLATRFAIGCLIRDAGRGSTEPAAKNEFH